MRFDGNDITGLDPAALVRRRVGPGARTAADLQRPLRRREPPARRHHGTEGGSRATRMAEMAELFPVLGQQMGPVGGLPVGRPGAAARRRAGADERPEAAAARRAVPGLAPTMVDVIFDLLEQLRAQGRTVLVVEQHAQRVLELADRGYVLRTGEIVGRGQRRRARRPRRPVRHVHRRHLTASDADRDELVQNLIDGLGNGSTYALLAVGMSMLFGVMHLVNFAHGELLTVGGLRDLRHAQQRHRAGVATIPVAILSAVVLSMAIEFVAFRRVRGASAFTLLLTSFAIEILSHAAWRIGVSSKPRRFTPPDIAFKAVESAAVQHRGVGRRQHRRRRARASSARRRCCAPPCSACRSGQRRKTSTQRG